MSRTFIIVSSFCLLLALGLFLTSVASAGETQITSDSVPQDTPNVWGDHVVWSDTRNGNWDNIYMYKVSTGITTQITNQPGRGATPITGEITWWGDPYYVFQNSPNIDGNMFTWFDARNGNYDIFMYDISTSQESVVTTNTATQVDPFIDGDKIVWVDYRNASDTVPPYDVFKDGYPEQNADIYMYDISTGAERQITSNPSAQRRPEMDGSYIVWHDGRNDPTMLESPVNRFSFNSNYDIYMYNLATGIETQVTSEVHNQRQPLISGNRIVWMDKRNGDWDVYMYDIPSRTETALVVKPGVQRRPAIWGNWVVYTDEGPGGPALKLLDLATSYESTITTSSMGQPNRPYIENKKIVWEDRRDSHNEPDVYLYEFEGAFTEAGAAITVGPAANVTLTFQVVTDDGTSTADVITSSIPNPPQGFEFNGDVLDITTTAGFTGPVNITILYNEEDIEGNESDLKLFHFEEGNWVDRTLSVDIVNNTISGQLSSFSLVSLASPLGEGGAAPATGKNKSFALLLSALTFVLGFCMLRYGREVGPVFDRK